jgi:tetratricopeptide (TPR) repeat protein
MRWRYLTFAVAGSVFVSIGIQSWDLRLAAKPFRSISALARDGDLRSETSSPCALALVPHKGEEKIDRQIKQFQNQVRANRDRIENLKRLGWAFVTKARLSYDPGYYKLAEQCSRCVQWEKVDDLDALLLQGHVWQSMHRFKQAEPVVRRLAALRGDALSYGLLGDVLMEQGKLREAAISYQKMIDRRPNPEAYTRVAHLRWLKGDLEGAIEAINFAITGGGNGAPEPTAWAYTRLGLYEFQAGEVQRAANAAETALQFTGSYAPALLLRGRILLAQGKGVEAVDTLQRAAALTELPEYQWTLADALLDCAQSQAAIAVENSLCQRGASADPRTFALYLATRKERTQEALKLAQDELKTRADVLTLDALAWALYAERNYSQAREYSRKALSEGTEDARLFYHAACINLASGDSGEARKLFLQGDAIKQMLLPSERADFTKHFAALRRSEGSAPLPSSN